MRKTEFGTVGLNPRCTKVDRISGISNRVIIIIIILGRHARQTEIKNPIVFLGGTLVPPIAPLSRPDKSPGTWGVWWI